MNKNPPQIHNTGMKLCLFILAQVLLGQSWEGEVSYKICRKSIFLIKKTTLFNPKEHTQRNVFV